MTQNIGSAFRDADGEFFPRLVRCLDFMNSLPFFRAYKSHSWRSLQIEAGQTILDLACGTGADLITLASHHTGARFIGVDSSAGFLDLARRRAAALPNLSFLQGDGARLPLEDGVVDGARVDRSLQHMEKPGVALAEMVRVTKKGGRIVACEPDWESFILFNGERSDSDKIAQAFRRSIRNPFIGRELAALMQDCGVGNLQTHVSAFWTGRLDEADVIFDLRKVKDQCATAGLMTRSEAERWWTLSQEATQKATFFAGLNVVETRRENLAGQDL